MSRDAVNGEEKEKKDVNFNTLVADTEARILEYQNKIKNLRKSLVFFKKKADAGVPFPALDDTRHTKIS